MTGDVITFPVHRTKAAIADAKKRGADQEKNIKTIARALTEVRVTPKAALVGVGLFLLVNALINNSRSSRASDLY